MMRRSALFVLAALFCASCSSAVSGTPAAGLVPPQLPPRPRELRIDGLDPCNTLTAEQIKVLDVGFYGRDQPDGQLGPGCVWIHSPYEPVQNYTVDINTQGGVELAFGQPRLEVLTVAGFGAVSTPGLYSSGDTNCIINVDVASQQAVQVGYLYMGRTVPMTHEIACRNAHNAAEMAIQTIVQKLGR